MANYEAKLRTNYVLVRDPAAFQSWVEALDLEVMTSSSWPGRYGIFSEAPLPTSIYDAHTDTERDIDVIDELAAHLQPDQVAIIIEVGWERMRYLAGFATAVNAAGERRDMSLDTIVQLALDLLPSGSSADTLSTPDY